MIVLAGQRKADEHLLFLDRKESHTWADGWTPTSLATVLQRTSTLAPFSDVAVWDRLPLRGFCGSASGGTPAAVARAMCLREGLDDEWDCHNVPSRHLTGTLLEENGTVLLPPLRFYGKIEVRATIFIGITRVISSKLPSEL